MNDESGTATAQWHLLYLCLWGVARGFSGFVVVVFGAFIVGFAGVVAIGAVREFVALGVVQGEAVALAAVGCVAGHGREQEHAERGPEAFEAQAAGRQFRQRGGLAAELDHEVISHLRG